MMIKPAVRSAFISVVVFPLYDELIWIDSKSEVDIVKIFAWYALSKKASMQLCAYIVMCAC